MDLSLFSKYSKAIKQQEDKKQIVVEILTAATGVPFSVEEVEIKKTKVTLSISSAKKMKLHQTGAKELLRQQGYELLY